MVKKNKGPSMMSGTPAAAAVSGAGGYKRGGKVKSKEEKRESAKTERKEKK